MMLRRRLNENEKDISITGLNYSTSIVANDAGNTSRNVLTELSNYLPSNYYYAIVVSENSSFIQNEFVLCVYIKDCTIIQGFRYRDNTYQQRQLEGNDVDMVIKAGTKLSIYYKLENSGTILTDKWNYKIAKLGATQKADQIISALNNTIEYSIAILVTDLNYSTSELSNLDNYQFVSGMVYKLNSQISASGGLRIVNNAYATFPSYSATYDVVIDNSQVSLIIYK